MSKERIKISDALYDIMPSDYQDLVKSATYGKEDRGWKDIGNSKELIEQHSLCAGCPESMAFRPVALVVLGFPCFPPLRDINKTNY